MNKKILLVLVLVFIIIFGGLQIYYRTNVVPPEFVKYAGNWPMANHDYSNTREYKGPGIDSSNVSKLGLSWKLPIKGISEWGAATTNPIILGSFRLDRKYWRWLRGLAIFRLIN